MSAAVGDALKRLQGALGVLEATIARRLESEFRRGDLETELQLMQDDRARLAIELESSAARLVRVESATEHVGRRVHAAVGVLRDVIETADAARATYEG